MMLVMRTTLTIEDDIYAIAKSMAAVKNIAVGTALSELARRGLERSGNNSLESDFPSFSVSEKAIPFGLQEVKTSEDEL